MQDFCKLNLSFRIINNLNFRKLLEMLSLYLILLNRIKLFKIILSKYNQIRKKIKINLRKTQYVSIVLNI